MVRPHELACTHGVGHQIGSHGCDGCCGLVFGGLADKERDRIIGILQERLADLESCNKRDNCQDLAYGIRLALSDIEWQEERSKGWAESVAEMKEEWPD